MGARDVSHYRYQRRHPSMETSRSADRKLTFHSVPAHRSGTMDKAVKVGPRAVGWPASEVAAINAARIAGQTDEQIRQLVARLEANRRLEAAGESLRLMTTRRCRHDSDHYQRQRRQRGCCGRPPITL